MREKRNSLLLKTYRFWSPMLRESYRPYEFEGGWIYLNIKESQMMLQRALGRYEPLKHQALRHFLRPGSTFIDVGCNKGDFALVASRLVGPTGRVLAFEPHPENCRWIQTSIAKNGYRNVDLSELALGDTNGFAQLHLGEKSGFHTLRAGLPQREKGLIEVKTRRLDDLLRETHFERSINAIKIDVEGAEMEVLRGAQETLLSNPGIVIFLDVHPHLGVNAEEVCYFLQEIGFALYKELPPFNSPLEDHGGVRCLIATR